MFQNDAKYCSYPGARGSRPNPHHMQCFLFVYRNLQRGEEPAHNAAERHCSRLQDSGQQVWSPHCEPLVGSLIAKDWLSDSWSTIDLLDLLHECVFLDHKLPQAALTQSSPVIEGYAPNKPGALEQPSSCRVHQVDPIMPGRKRLSEQDLPHTLGG